MLLSNPKINGSQTTVPAVLNALPRTNPTQYTVEGSIPVPPWSSLNPLHSIEWHYQGIAPYNGSGISGCISASSDSGYFSGFSQATGEHPQVRSVVVPDADYFHAAGIQMLGDLLAVPLESGEGEKAKVAFYDVGNLGSPAHLYDLQMPAKKASAVGIATYTDSAGVEQCLLVVYEYDNYQMYIYRAPASGLTSGSSWQHINTYTGGALDCGDQFQGFALVTQANSSGDEVYMLGFREDEELWLYTVDTNPTSDYGNFTLVTHYTGWNGSDWRNGMGLQIISDTNMRLFGTAKDPSGNSDYPNGSADYSFKIYVYG